MPTYGAYETISELSRGAICTVWTARRTGEGAGAEYAIRLCQPDADIAGLEQAQRAVEYFLDQVSVQKKMTGASPAGSVWAPIHDSGRTDGGDAAAGGGGIGGAYYVTDLYPRGSVEKMVTSRARPDTRTLHAVVAGVMAAIRQIRDLLRRPHGNLHPGNVLIDGDGAGMRVLIADPAATSALKPGADSTIDLRALGAILYQLVTHQEYHERSGWPVADSPDWKRLPGGERWRALCNRLLDPNPSAPPTVEEIEQTLLNLGEGTKKGSGKKVLIGVGAVAVLGAIGVGVALLMKPPAAPLAPIPVVTSQEWVTLVTEYDNWFGAFADDLRDNDARVRMLVARSPEFKRWQEALKGDLGDPWKIAGLPRSTSAEQLKQSPPESVGKEAGARATAALLGVITSVRGAMTGGGWSMAREGGELSQSWRARGWEEGAAQIDRALAEVKVDLTLMRRAEGAARAVERAEAVEKAYAEAGLVVKRVEEGSKNVGGDKVLDSFRAWAEAYPGRYAKESGGDKVIDGLLGGVERVKGAATAVAAFLESPARVNVCFDELSKSEVYARFAPETAGPEVFEDWTSEAKKQQYANPSPAEDPRVGKDLLEPIGRMAGELEKLKKYKLEPAPDSLATLEAVGTALGAASSSGTDLAGRLGAIRARAEALRALPWDCRKRAEIESIRYDAVLKQLDEVARTWRTQNAREELDKQTEIARLQRLESPVRDSEAIRSWWTTQRDAVLRDPNADAQFEKGTALESKLVELDKGVARWEPPKVAAGREGAWVRNVERAASQRRDAAIGAFLRGKQEASWSDADVRAVGEEVANWGRSLTGAVDAALTAERLLNAGYGLDEAPPGGGKTVAALAGEATAVDGLGDALSPVVSRVTALRQAAAAGTTAALAPLVTQDPSNRPELTLAAWRRLGRVENGAWPRTLQDLELETREFRAALRAVVNAEGLASRREELGGEISAGRQARWEAFVKRAATEADLAAALSPERTLRELEVDAAKAGDPMVQYRIAAFEFKRAVSAAGASDEQVRSAIDRFVKAVPGDLAGGARVAPVLTELRALLREGEQGPPKIDPRTLGPVAAGGGGWAAEELAAAGGGSMLRFRKGPLTLDFLRVEPGAGAAEAFYLGVDEISVGQFVQVIDGAGGGAWQSVLEMMPGAEDAPESARAWRWQAGRGNEAGKVALAGEWLQSNRPSVGIRDTQRPAYAREFLRDGSEGKAMIATMAPKLGSPMHQITPAVAVYAATLVGCRLPTAAEWKAAAANPSGGTANLRDLTWKVQFDYVKSTRAQMANPEHFILPDAGAFAPGVAQVGDDATVAPNAGTDSWVWFAPVTEGATSFSNLRGNVAELVLTGSAGMPGSADSRGATEFVTRRARELAVIGGSAISPPQMSMEEAVGIPDADLAGTWADVGFRLAFSATGTQGRPRSKAEEVAAVLGGSGADLYLFGR